MTDVTDPGSLRTPVRQADVFAWRMERDPLLRSTITAVTVLDRAPDRAVLLDRLERATRLAPMFRERLVPAPLPLPLATPTWALDPDLDLSWHVRWVALPAPASLDAAFDLARIEGMTAFDPARPLWELTVVEGLPDGRAAMIIKVHHSLTDGIGGIQLAGHVVDLEREPADRGPLPPLPAAGPRASGTERAREALVHDLAAVARTVAGGLRRLPAGVRRAVTDPVGIALGAVRTVASIARFVAPITDTLSPVMTERRLVWRYAALDVPFDDLHAAAHAVNGTLNDAFVAAVTGGLRRYHGRHEARIEQVRMTMPVSVRTEDDPAGGNRITLLRFPVPVDEPDPVTRMIAIDRLTAGLRHEPAIGYSEVIAGVLNLLPPAITGSMLKHVDVLASNVPGFSRPVYVAGARVEGFYACGPTIGSSANITLMSYAGTCCVGVTTDAGAVPDADVFLDCLREGFDEVLALAPGGRTATVRARSWAAHPEWSSSPEEIEALRRPAGQA
ncbi:wax ester/triacylglycerol synthase domain-containing protein [Rhabdothermincola sediminis]|uniref:wax ester/triacylglycerol synthase domain-containing protein n=1 Tax=Rhabdothermincola sediminis TaxID=2751370 RepID=UPI001AA04C13|nr:wax ester/triacylglycerol synthase domain-containing protein [Rhabdothermincola sediminis]